MTSPRPRTRVTIRVDESVLQSQLMPHLQQRTASLTRRIANQARQDVPVLTGNLGRSIREDPITVTGMKVESGVTAHADYAAAVHEGRKGGKIIVPVRAKALRFNIGGRVVYARRVVMGAVKARPFLRNAAERIIAAER